MWTTSEGARAVEFRIGLRSGETCFDYQRHGRVQETAQALLLEQINVPLDLEPVRCLLEAGFDEPLGPLPRGTNRPPDTDAVRPCP